MSEVEFRELSPASLECIESALSYGFLHGSAVPCSSEHT
jgi:hypothetical protein